MTGGAYHYFPTGTEVEYVGLAKGEVDHAMMVKNGWVNEYDVHQIIAFRDLRPVDEG